MIEDTKIRLSKIQRVKIQRYDDQKQEDSETRVTKNTKVQMHTIYIQRLKKKRYNMKEGMSDNRKCKDNPSGFGIGIGQCLFNKWQ